MGDLPEDEYALTTADITVDPIELYQLRIEQLEKHNADLSARITDLEEKNCHYEIARDNLIVQRDEALDRAKAKGERAAAVIKRYRVALQCGIDYVFAMKYSSTSLPQILDGLLDKFEAAAKEAMSFGREKEDADKSAS